MNKETPWWQTLYDENLAAMLLENGDFKEVEQTCGFLKDILHLKPGQLVFDQCCGTGRLALALSEQHKVVGIDLIESYIKAATLKAEKLNRQLELVCADAFEFRLPESADIAINWWTSFGYSESDETNILMIQRAFESIKSGGLYALDFMNVPGVYRHFLRDVVTTLENKGSELVLIRKSQIDFEKDRLIKEWRYFDQQGEKARHYSDVSLYSPAQLLKMFQRVGFESVQLYGNLQGEKLELDSPRCIVVGRKP